MRTARYAMLLSLAVPGLFTEHQIRYELSQARGWAYVHAWLDFHRHDLRWLKDEYNDDHAYEESVRARYGAR